MWVRLQLREIYWLCYLVSLVVTDQWPTQNIFNLDTRILRSAAVTKYVSGTNSSWNILVSMALNAFLLPFSTFLEPTNDKGK